MAVYLDEQLDDEPLFGVVSRYIEMSPSIYSKRVIRFLYGKEVYASMMGGSFGHVAAQTQTCWGLSPQEIIRGMTLFPYISGLINKEAADKLLEKMIGPESGGSNRAGIWRSLEGKEFRYCTRCIAEDREQGVPLHWRRTHQLPGVVTCVHHGEFLWRYKAAESTRSLGFVTPEFAHTVGVSPVVSNSMNVRKQAALQYAKLSHELLSGSVIIDRECLFEILSQTLRRGLKYYGKNKYRECIFILIENYFGRDYLRCIGFGVRQNSIWTSRENFINAHPSGIVISASLMQLIERDPELLDDRHFKAVYDSVPLKNSNPRPPFRVRPPVECPNTLAEHGAGHIVEKTSWRDSELRCACSCGMRFRCAELDAGIGPPQIKRWGDAYVREVRRLRSDGYDHFHISKMLGLPLRTVLNM